MLGMSNYHSQGRKTDTCTGAGNMQRALILRENKKTSIYVSKIDMEVVELIPLDFFLRTRASIACLHSLR
jgi:hypothetical protein